MPVKASRWFPAFLQIGAFSGVRGPICGDDCHSHLSAAGFGASACADTGAEMPSKMANAAAEAALIIMVFMGIVLDPRIIGRGIRDI
ncbi:hypothetical protein [Sphingobium subterraneum]|uniref:Uncharacterized protein n=1 Tax=Sphingobium subterraneum TaxID=627688 RepID=A0A841J4D1_9SPHN|nr:hypothetical protein [Sphingobium subterraneum]MBB6125570.1 hypothetical protein [Sphingobium subterraneum]